MLGVPQAETEGEKVNIQGVTPDDTLGLYHSATDKSIGLGH